jgi:UDP-N-acetylglucosamine acyltransferase
LAHIHPTSIVDDQARLASDVEIGPFCIIQGEVTLGAGCRLVSHVHLKGPMTAGTNNLFYPQVCIGFAPQSRREDPSKVAMGVLIGDDNIFREGVTVHRASMDIPTTIGNDNFLMAYSHLGHDVVMANHCTIANTSLIAGHVHIADNVNIGGTGGVHQFCRVGRFSMISGTMGITRDLPPFVTVHQPIGSLSLNIIGMRRAGFNKHIPAVKKAFKILFRDKHTNPVAVQLIREECADDPLALEMADFVEQSKRGIVPTALKRYAFDDGDSQP